MVQFAVPIDQRHSGQPPAPARAVLEARISRPGGSVRNRGELIRQDGEVVLSLVAINLQLRR